MPTDDGQPMQIPADDAVEAIHAAAARLLARTPRIVIGITGPVGAGKTSIARGLSDCIVHADDFLPDYSDVPYDERDEPHHADLATLSAILARLRAGHPAESPIWSHHTHRREGTRTITPAPHIVCEGIHALCPPVAEVIDLRIYIDAPADLRRRRWTDIEESGDRGWGVEAAMAFFDDVAEPTFNRHGATARATAHIIVMH
jgi:uridine kinase